MPATDNGTCKKGQLIARGFRQHKRLGAFLRSRYGGTSWPSNNEVHELSKDEGVGELSVSRPSSGGRVPKDAWPSFRENASRRADVRRRGRGRQGHTVREAAANAKRQREACGELADAVASIEDAAENPTDVADVAYSRHCEKTGCLRDDEQGCVTGRKADALFKLADKFYYGRYNGGDGGRAASRLGMHPFLSELLRNFRDDLREKERRLRLYAGHDTVVAPLLAALGIFDGKWPPLAAASSSSLGKAGRCAFYSTAATCPKRRAALRGRPRGRAARRARLQPY